MNFRKQSKDGKFGSVIIDWLPLEDALYFEYLTRKYFSDKKGKFKFGDCLSFLLSIARAEFGKKEAFSKLKKWEKQEN